jgi:hypothetical protein
MMIKLDFRSLHCTILRTVLQQLQLRLPNNNYYNKQLTEV